MAAIHEATLQVLEREGLARLTTIRVAERAGVSVGTLYQYFPNKQSLQYALLLQHFNTVACALEAVRDAPGPRALPALAADLARAYVRAKTTRPADTQTLYRVATALQHDMRTTGTYTRLMAVVRDTLAQACDTQLNDPDRVARALLATWAGLSRAAFAGELRTRCLEDDAVTLAQAYVVAMATGAAQQVPHTAP